MSDDIPADWQAALARRSLGSYRRLAGKANISHEAARRVVRGANVKRASIKAVADAMGVDVEEVYRLRGESAPDFSRDWTPPAVSATLTHEEREALNRLIHLMTAGRAEAGEGHAGPAPTTEAPRGRRKSRVTIEPRTLSTSELRPKSSQRPDDDTPGTSARR